ncbi:NAD-dependent epimerase/dehydratase family protein [Gammaproteobacteria bacterium]|nr:NAD-dependent epimerase/dehydratase family protein [Gammaproteobacteria bacterium]
MKYILVTGAAGFIGAAVATFLLKKNRAVVTVDNLSTGDLDNIPNGCVFIEGDVSDVSVLAELEKYDIDAIIHIAGQSSGEVSFSDPVYDLDTNTKSTLLLLKYARESGIDRFIYASTMSVYGGANEIVNETMCVKPVSFYGVGKLASEQYLEIFSKYKIRCTSLRFFNVYGPGQNMENMQQGMASIFLSQAIKNNKIIVKGSGERYRDFIYIDDVVTSVIACLESMKDGHEVINVGTGIKTKVKDLISEIQNIFDDELDIIYHGSTEGDVHGIVADNARLMTKVSGGYKFTSVRDGLRKMANWAQQKPNDS